MRPTVDEQLQGICRILENTVLAEVEDAHAQEVLRGVISNLSMLSQALPRLNDFLRWDTEETRSLLESVGAHSAVVEPTGNTGQAEDLNEQNTRVRAELSAIIRRGDLDDAALENVRRHLVERSRRTPIRYATVLPSASSAKE